MIKLILCIIVAIVAVLWQVASRWPDNYLHIVACDVGQGDAILLSYGFSQVLIDGGVDGSLVTQCLDAFMPWADRTIDLVVATHADADHIGGLTTVLERYSIGELLINGEQKETDVFKQFYSLVQSRYQHGEAVSVPDLGDTWFVGQRIRVSSLFPREEHCQKQLASDGQSETTLQDVFCKPVNSSASSNDRSIVLIVQFDSISILLMGDLEIDGERSLLSRGLLEKTTIVKAGHHGAKTSSTADFVATTQPEIVLISSGKNNRYGHPSPEVLSRYDAVNSVILRTDQEGTIELLSDGDRVWQRK